MKQEVKNRVQDIAGKNDRKNKQETAAVRDMQQPNAQENTSFFPQGQRFIRSWVEGTPDAKR